MIQITPTWLLNTQIWRRISWAASDTAPNPAMSRVLHSSMACSTAGRHGAGVGSQGGGCRWSPLTSGSEMSPAARAAPPLVQQFRRCTSTAATGGRLLGWKRWHGLPRLPMRCTPSWVTCCLPSTSGAPLPQRTALYNSFPCPCPAPWPALLPACPACRFPSQSCTPCPCCACPPWRVCCAWRGGSRCAAWETPPPRSAPAPGRRTCGTQGQGGAAARRHQRANLGAGWKGHVCSAGLGNTQPLQAHTALPLVLGGSSAASAG